MSMEEPCFHLEKFDDDDDDTSNDGSMIYDAMDSSLNQNDEILWKQNLRKFRAAIREELRFVCLCCGRLFFREQGIIVSQNEMESWCKFLSETSSEQTFVCKTCRRTLLLNKMPKVSLRNNLDLAARPKFMQEMNELEQQLVALHIPFRKVIGLRGGQLQMKGPVVCVPSETVTTVSNFPWADNFNELLLVKLKRKQVYKGHQLYMGVDVKKLRDALKYFVRHHEKYAAAINSEDLAMIEDWFSNRTAELVREDDVNALFNKDRAECEKFNKKAEKDEDEEEELPFNADTFMMPEDLAQDICDSGNVVWNVAPSEGNTPISVLNSPGIESTIFPSCFPNGKNTFNCWRPLPLSIVSYFQARLTSADNRFAKNSSYVFFAGDCCFDLFVME